MMKNQLAFAVVNININYRRPALLGDVLNIKSQMLELGGKSGVITQTVMLAPAGERGGRCLSDLGLYRFADTKSTTH